MLNSLKISVEVCRGTTIQRACDDAKTLSELIHRDIIFTFNNVQITTKDHSINDMLKRYNTQMAGC